MVVGGVVEAVGVGQERAKSRAQLESLVPILAGAGRPAHLQAEDQADAVQREIGQEPLEPRTALGRLAALAEVVVDDHDLVATPAEFDGAIGEGLLAGGGFAMIEDLLGRGLSDVDDGGPGGVPGSELGRSSRSRDIIHDRLRAWRPLGDGPSTARGAGAAGGDVTPGAWPKAMSSGMGAASAGVGAGGTAEGSEAVRDMV